MIISVVSGKGGTGKTSIAVNLALTLEEGQFLDCDVEEPNAFLFLKPKITDQMSVQVSVPEIDTELCNGCGACVKACTYNALAQAGNKILIFENICHSCSACWLVCPQKAIKEGKRTIGTIEKGQLKSLECIQGELNLKEPSAVPVIKKMKTLIDQNKTTIIDGPPGTSCPAIEAIKGSDFCLLVTEPTPFGLHDLKVIVEVVKEQGIPCGLVINRSQGDDRIAEEFAQKEKLPILLTIPLEKDIAHLYSKGIPFSQVMPQWQHNFKALLKSIEAGEIQ